jgi:Tfp pilus assembly protein PilF
LAEGDLQAARRALETALVIEPAKAKAHYNLGLLFLTLGRPADARAHFESAVKWGGAELQLAAAKYLNPEN